MANFLDQAVQSIISFIFTLVLARLLGIDEFGWMAMAQIVALYAFAFYTSLIAEPFSVNYSRFQGAMLVEYLRWIHRFYGVLCAGFFMVLCLAALVFELCDRPGIARICFGAGLAVPAYFTLGHTRRVYYALKKNRSALAGSVAYGFLLVCGLALLYYSHQLTAITALLVFGLAGTVVAIPLIPEFLPSRSQQPPEFQAGSFWRCHWDYAKWHLGGTLLTGLGTFIGYPILALVGGVGASGALRLVETLYAPLNQGLTAFVVVLMPRLAALREERGLGSVKHVLKKFQALFLVLLGLLLVVMFSAGERVMCLIFGNEQGHGLGLAAAFYGILIGCRIWFDLGPVMVLRMIRDTRAFFVNGWMAGLAGSVLVGVVAITGQLIPVVLSRVVVALMTGLVFLFFARRVSRNEMVL